MKKKRIYWINKTRDLEINNKYRKGAKVKDLAKEYKVTSSRITQINQKCKRYYKRLTDLKEVAND
jgi:Mor family transcriptional regulator